MKLVNSSAIEEFSSALSLDKMLLMSTPMPQGRCKVYQDVFEAFVGAVYLDYGYQVVFDWCKLLFTEHFPPGRLWSDSNYKDILNKLQTQMQCQVHYTRLKTTGSPHNMTYHVQVTAGCNKAYGVGRTVRLAEQDASFNLLKMLGFTTFVTGTNATLPENKKCGQTSRKTGIK